MVNNQPDRLGPELLVILLRHDVNNLPSKEGVHESRGGSLRQARGGWAADPELRDKYRSLRPNVERVVSYLFSAPWEAGSP